MAYTPTEWNDGDVITKEKMNKLEQGVKAIAGMEGTATAVTDIATPDSATTKDVATKVNELLAALRTRGVIGS